MQSLPGWTKRHDTAPTADKARTVRSYEQPQCRLQCNVRRAFTNHCISLGCEEPRLVVVVGLVAIPRWTFAVAVVIDGRGCDRHVLQIATGVVSSSP